MHIYDMFDEMPIMASRGPVKSLLKYLHFYMCFDVTFNFWKFHRVLGSGLSPGPKKVAPNLESLAKKYLEKSLVTGMPHCGSEYRVPVTCMPMSRERLRL